MEKQRELCKVSQLSGESRLAARGERCSRCTRERAGLMNVCFAVPYLGLTSIQPKFRLGEVGRHRPEAELFFSEARPQTIFNFNLLS